MSGLLVAVLLHLVVASSIVSASDQSLFEDFVQKFRSGNGDYDYAARFAIFQQNLRKIEKWNSDTTNTYRLGITSFADMTPEEFAKMYLSTVPPPPSGTTVNVADLPVAESNAPPTPVDWSSQGAVAPVKNQGSCGSCWAFSAVGAIESAWKIAGNPLTSLSEQQVLDCNFVGQFGCNGGYPSVAMDYVKSIGGLVPTTTYPYTAVQGKCRFCGDMVSSSVTKVSSTFTCFPCSYTSIISAVQSQPLSVAVYAGDNWYLYTSGVMTVTSQCTTSNANHGVLLVGFGTDAYSNDFWKIKNSWGTNWGESGYIRLQRISGSDSCRITSQVSWPNVASPTPPAASAPCATLSAAASHSVSLVALLLIAALVAAVASL